MLNKLLHQIRKFDMLKPGEEVACAVSGGADSMALLWAMYLLREKLEIKLSAVHFNHQLRAEESDRDEAFVRAFCDRFEIPLYCGCAQVTAGKKGLEAAARDARYAYFETLPCKVATAHTANDNAETVLMHLVRGTGLKGLGAIAPVNGRRIRPMLTVTRDEAVALLREYHIDWVEDSSNHTDAFLRNRLRHHVMPLLEKENPRIAENLSAMAMELREDAQALESMSGEELPQVSVLRSLPPAVRSRLLASFLTGCGVREPERNHIGLLEDIVFSENPSAKAMFPGGITVCRNYDRLEFWKAGQPIEPLEIRHPGVTAVPACGAQIRCTVSNETIHEGNRFTVFPRGKIYLRSKVSGDTIRLQGGTKSLKKLFIDHKIPAQKRLEIPVLADEDGIIWVLGFGPNLNRLEPGMEICWEPAGPGEEK